MPDQKQIIGPIRREVEVSQQLPQWGEFLAQCSSETIYHDPRWGEIMQQAYGNCPFYLTARSEGQITGILQLVEQKSLVFGHHLCSLPYFDASGILAQDDRAAQALLDRARNLLVEQATGWIELRHLQRGAGSIPVRCDKVTMHLGLPDSEEELWLQFKPKVRTKIRKAQREELKVKRGGIELINEFYQVYSRNMRDLGSPAHSRGFFQLVMKNFPIESKIYLVCLKGKAIAGSLCLTDRHALRVPWAGNDWRWRKLNANMILYWSMLADGSRGAVKHFDFGRSSLNSGTYMFKKQWGAKEVPLFWLFLLPDGKELPDMTPDSKKYRSIVACWKKLPIWVTQQLGPRIISKLS